MKFLDLLKMAQKNKQGVHRVTSSSKRGRQMLSANSTKGLVKKGTDIGTRDNASKGTNSKRDI